MAYSGAQNAREGQPVVHHSVYQPGLMDERLFELTCHDPYGSLGLDPDPELAFTGVRALRGLAEFCEGYQVRYLREAKLLVLVVDQCDLPDGGQGLQDLTWREPEPCPVSLPPGQVHDHEGGHRAKAVDGYLFGRSSGRWVGRERGRGFLAGGRRLLPPTASMSALSL